MFSISRSLARLDELARVISSNVQKVFSVANAGIKRRCERIVMLAPFFVIRLQCNRLVTKGAGLQKLNLVEKYSTLTGAASIRHYGPTAVQQAPIYDMAPVLVAAI